ncbi:Probable E3 ubiquitin-protein ligase HERC1 (HECT domain and RCC1-like domain-containing protein 1) (HECT-type E3 ubiquitin transferase HERC1) (p532) (p619) [Durusdinium trenchii]|uniref:Probable E3 ubiquitin-protein ligase HERC1 (HECT domain and RCC1-like domain-containing protein 1) (HECT-type E3 ubiquitin transferase HERC1) (p532) (p619) n=1 Tax=Durusdinium trenchii TaxID=1381693 RepID=A0ABP0MIH3_9DINO
MSEPAQKGTSPWFTFRAGAHSQERDSVELPFVFAKLALAPEYNGRQIRITNMLAEYWDEANMGLLALEGLKHGGWDKSHVFPVVAVGLWYAYNMGCQYPWCSTRPSIAGLHTEAIVDLFLSGMRRTGKMGRWEGWLDGTLMELGVSLQSLASGTNEGWVTATGQPLLEEARLADSPLRSGATLTALLRRRPPPGHWPHAFAMVAKQRRAGQDEVVRQDGSLVAWGARCTGRPQRGDVAVAACVCSFAAFAARRTDGSVYSWGEARYGGDSSAVQAQLVKVQQLAASYAAFAALKSDGTVVVWGDADYGGHVPEEVQSQLKEVRELSATRYAFAALCSHGRVVTWGQPTKGGLCPPFKPPPPPPAPAGVLGTALGPVRQIVASSAAFVAIHDNGQVFGWGEDCEPSSAARGRLESASVASVACSGKAFAALTEDGEVICWGDEIFGGNPKESCGGAAEDLKDVQAVFASSFAFCALKTDGSVILSAAREISHEPLHLVICWGNPRFGGSLPAATAVELRRHGVRTVLGSGGAFAALLGNGTVKAWGERCYGGEIGAQEEELQEVKEIQATYGAFAAIRSDGTVVTRGDARDGGDSSAVKEHLTKVKCSSRAGEKQTRCTW